MSKLFGESNRKIFMIFVVITLIFSAFNILTTADNENLPDLTITDLECPDNIGEGETLEVNTKIKNIGDENISAGTIIRLGLYIDNTLVATNTTGAGLAVDSSVFVNLSWTATLGDETQRLLRVIVDYLDTIPESDENNNVWDKFIDVEEKDTELEIIKVDLPNSFQAYETADISVNIKNNGKSTTNTIYAKLSTDEEGEIQTLKKNGGLSKYETHEFAFEWTPQRFGSQILHIDIYLTEDDIHDSYEKTVLVNVGQLEWWNSSWHYRHFVVVNGSGNLSINLNFTQFLNDLNIYSYEFENDTIRIIKYHTNGSVVNDGEVKVFKFNESTDFNKMTNANGTLIWNVTGSGQKYYCVYFDVKDNIGYRTGLDETDDINVSGDVYLNFSGFLGGWWTEIIEPTNGSYALVNESVNMSVHTIAKADNVTAYIFWNEDESHSFTLYLSDDGTNTDWYYNNFKFDKEGNWTIRIISRDTAGYEPAVVEHDFYVGKPDLEIVNITIETDWPPTSPNIYKSDTATITAHLKSYNATLKDVTVYLSIYDINNNVTFYNDSKTGLTILKDKDNPIDFDWYANRIGDFKIMIIVDSGVEELNELNNNLSINVTVYGWPDLSVENVIIPVDSVGETDKVRVYAVIGNYGEANATDYEIGLCVESASHDSMTYSNVIGTAYVSVDMNKTKQISLYWDSAKPGNWMVGVKIITSGTKRDTNIVNNQFLSNVTLKVEGIERNPPQISDVKAISIVRMLFIKFSKNVF